MSSFVLFMLFVVIGGGKIMSLALKNPSTTGRVAGGIFRLFK